MRFCFAILSNLLFTPEQEEPCCAAISGADINPASTMLETRGMNLSHSLLGIGDFMIFTIALNSALHAWLMSPHNERRGKDVPLNASLFSPFLIRATAALRFGIFFCENGHRQVVF